MTPTELSERTSSHHMEVREVVASVVDPELPLVTIDELGILRSVGVDADGCVDVTITPTYSGCPAMETIRADIAAALRSAGCPEARVHTVLSPPWTTDWLSESGRRKLADAGIAPPGPAGAAGPVPVALGVACPRCRSRQTRLTSRFGSTACKALYACSACSEPFDAMKAV